MARRAEGWKLSRQDGWYYLRFRHEGRRCKLACGTKDSAEAARLAPQLYAEALAGQRPARRLSAAVTTPLDELVALWLASLEGPGGLDPRTLHSYLCYARAQWLPRWQRLGQLTAPALRGYVRERLRAVTRATVRKEASALRGLLGWAREQDLLPEVPQVEIPRRAAGVRQRTRQPVPLSPEEVAAVLAQLPDRAARGYPVRAYAEFLWETGLRASTVEAIAVPASWAPGQHELLIDDEDDKARWGRRVPLSARAVTLLEAHAPEQGPVWGRHRLLEALKAAALAAGLEPERARRLAPYDLRHARLTALAEVGASRGALQLLAGHTRPATTDRYLHGVEGAARAALAALQPSAACPATEVACRAIGPAYGPASPSGGPRCEGPRGEVCGLSGLRGARGGT